MKNYSYIGIFLKKKFLNLQHRQLSISGRGKRRAGLADIQSNVCIHSRKRLSTLNY